MTFVRGDEENQHSELIFNKYPDLVLIRGVILDTELINTGEVRERAVPSVSPGLLWPVAACICWPCPWCVSAGNRTRCQTPGPLWKEKSRHTQMNYVNNIIAPKYETERITELSGFIYFWHNLCIMSLILFILERNFLFVVTFKFDKTSKGSYC